MNIRRATLSDLPALVRLSQSIQALHATAHPERFRQSTPAKAVESAFRAMIESPAWFWLVAEEDRAIGFLSAEFRDRDESWCLFPHRVCYLAGIAVEPDFRRRGIARALIAELQCEVEAREAISIDLDVWSFNEEARQAFARLGFRNTFERMTRVQTP